MAKNELNGGDSPPRLSCFGYAGEGPDALNVQQMQDNRDPELQVSRICTPHGVGLLSLTMMRNAGMHVCECQCNECIYI